MAWPDGGSNEVTKTIGATARDHEDITAWEAATDEDCTAGWGAGEYSDPCSPVGDCYDDGDFAETVRISGATTSGDYYRLLTVHEGERHPGTEASGVEVVYQSGWAMSVYLDKFFVVEWLLFTGVGGSIGPYYCPADSRHMYRNMVSALTGAAAFTRDNVGAGSEITFRNCIAYGMSGYGIYGTSEVSAKNCSVYGTASYLVYGVVCTNVISCGAGSGCFYSCTGDYNIGSDTSAPGEHSIDNIAGADIFDSVIQYSENLHLKSEETAANSAGDTLATEFTDDIDDDVRDGWDIGADEWVGAPPAGNPWHYYAQQEAAA